MNRISGALLREQRTRAGVGLRRVAGRSAWSVSAGHLSRVERGERPVTPAIVAVYEQALGIRIVDLLTDPARRRVDAAAQPPEAFITSVAAIAAGAETESIERLLAAASGPASPRRVGRSDVAHVEQCAALVRQLDLRYGGGLAGALADDLLRWTVQLRQAAMTDAVRGTLDAATGVLAMWAAWAAFDDGRYPAARALSTAALRAAVAAGDPDLRAHVLADLAVQYSYLGCPEQCLTLLRLAEDARVGPAVRSLIHGVRAHAYAATGQTAACRREIDLAAQVGAQVEPAGLPSWFGGFDPAHTRAVCGHALARLAAKTGAEREQAQAYRWLTEAVTGLDPAGRGRAAALCQVRLAMLDLARGRIDDAADRLGRSAGIVEGMRSGRLRRDLALVRETVAAWPDRTRLRMLAGRLAGLG